MTEIPDPADVQEFITDTEMVDRTIQARPPKSIRGMTAHDRLRWVTEMTPDPAEFITTMRLQHPDPETLTDSEIVDILIAAGKLPPAIRELTGHDRQGWITRTNYAEEPPQPGSHRPHYPPLFRPETRSTL